MKLWFLEAVSIQVKTRRSPGPSETPSGGLQAGSAYLINVYHTHLPLAPTPLLSARPQRPMGPVFEELC